MLTIAAAGLFGGLSIERPMLFWAYIAAVSFTGAAGGIAAGLHLESFEQADLRRLADPHARALSRRCLLQPFRPRLLAERIARYNPVTFLVGQGRRLYLGAGTPEPPVTILLAGLLGLAALGFATSAVASGKGMKIG